MRLHVLPLLYDNIAVKNERHFIASCEIYSGEREELWKNVGEFWHSDVAEENKFIFIMTDGNGDVAISDCVLKFVEKFFLKWMKLL